MLSDFLNGSISTFGLEFDGAETNCRIAHNLGTLLMISY